MTSIQIPDRSRASLAPYLTIPYGTLKLLGMVGSIVLAITALVAGHLWFPLYSWPKTLGVLISGLFLLVYFLIAKFNERDIDGFEDYGWSAYPRAYWNRNWRGYRLWVYQQNTVSAPVRYRITREGEDPAVFLGAEFLDSRDRPRVMISIPLGDWRSVPTVWVQDHPLDPRPFTIHLVDRKFRHDWQVIVRDFYGNRLTLPVEHALEIVSGRIPHPLLTQPSNTLSQVVLGLLKEHEEVKSRCGLYGGRSMDARAAIEKAVEMIRASTRYQHSKEGKAIRKFLELRYLMIANNESEEDARKKLADNAA